MQLPKEMKYVGGQLWLNYSSSADLYELIQYLLETLEFREEAITRKAK